MRKNLFEAKTLSLMPTWQCTASCLNCGTYSTPRNKTRLGAAELIDAIELACKEGFSVVVFTGGEATLRWDELLKAIRHAKELGLTTRLVTNGWWAHSAYAARTRLEKLNAAGLDEINFSTGDEHSRFVSIRTLIEGIACSIEIGFQPVVMIEVTAKAKLTREYLINTELFVKRLASNAANVKFLESPWMPLDPSTVEDYPEGMTANRLNLSSKTGCESLFSTYTVQANGRIGQCCGLGLQSVDALQPETFESGLSSFLRMQAVGELDIVKLLVRQIGPEKVLDRASNFDPRIKWENMYAHKCQACLRVFNDQAVLDAIYANENSLTVEFAASVALDQILQAEKLQ